MHALLRSVIECLLERSRVELVRGNLYAALISYLHLIFSPEGGFAGAQAVPTDNAPRALAMSTALMREETNFGSSRSGTPGPSAATSSPLFTGSLALIKAASDRLIAAVARDAIDGAEVWKTIAFMLLDALVQVSRTDSKSHVVLTSMVRSGVLGRLNPPTQTHIITMLRTAFATIPRNVRAIHASPPHSLAALRRAGSCATVGFSSLVKASRRLSTANALSSACTTNTRASSVAFGVHGFPPNSWKYSTNPEWARLPFPYTPQPKRFYRRLPHLLLNHPRPHTGTILLRVSMQPLHVPHPLIRPVPCPRVLAQRRHSKLRILCEFGLQHVYECGYGLQLYLGRG